MNEHTHTSNSHIPDINSLLAVIQVLVGDVHPKWKNLHFIPDTHLERELGLDSMARMELRARIETTLGIRLDETTAINATTPSDLMQAIITLANGSQAEICNTQSPLPEKHQASDLLMGSFGDGEKSHAALEPSRHTPGEWLYALYVWPVFLFIGLLTWLAVVLAPFESWRQKLAHIGARLFFRCAFIPFRVAGLEHLDPTTSCILVANHASYLDGFIITAALNTPVHFIAKGELSRVWPARLLLQRFGVEFVDRFNTNRGTSDIRRIAEKSRTGQSIVFFPEGTFTAFAGLQPFRMGAFVTATRSNSPIIPIAIKGARKIQRGNNWFPHHGQIRVTICQPVLPEGEGWQVALKLRDAARREISQFCGETDLVEDSSKISSGNE